MIAEIIIIISASVIVAAVIGFAVWKKVTGRGGCGCDCSACAGCNGKRRKKTCACGKNAKRTETGVSRNKE